MSALSYFLHISVNNLRRGGQRVVVALLCIAFGVMSLTAMSLLSKALERTLLITPREVLGADLSLTQEGALPADKVLELASLQQKEQIEGYTVIAYTNSLTFHLKDSGEAHFPAAGMGIDPSKYPLAGKLEIGQPGNVGAVTLLQDTGDVLVTRDLAEDYDLHPGDAIWLSDTNYGTPVQGWIQGIVYDTPNHQGSKVYYSLATAEELANGQPTLNTALVIAPNADALVKPLQEAGWNVYASTIASRSNQASANLIDILLKGSGILGLLVGGIGVANTMQVLLRRRQKEVAIWKAIGYNERQLYALFSIEAALLGGLGSLLGVAAGVFISTGLTRLFYQTGNLLVVWMLSPETLITTTLVGIFTTVIFSLWAIVMTSRAQPLALLRNEPVDVRKAPWFEALGLALLLTVPFVSITSLVMGSVWSGIGVLIFALAGLIIIGGLLGGALWLLARILPLGWLPLAKMAQNSLRRRGLGIVFAMIALYAGITTMALGVVFTRNAQSNMEMRTIHAGGYNLQIIAPPEQEVAVRTALAAQDMDIVGYTYEAPVKSIRLPNDMDGQEISGTHLNPLLIGSTSPANYILKGASWNGEAAGIYLPVDWGASEGSQVEITFLDGRKVILPVIGRYDIEWSPARLPPQFGVLMPASLFNSLAQPQLITAYALAPEDSINHLSRSLGSALPGATVINLDAYAARYTQQYYNLFILAMAMAGLALLAGVLLVANSVSLAMLDRRYEIGILKSVGYSRAHILVTLAVEYSLVGLIATLAGLVTVQVFLFVIGAVNNLAASLLLFTPASALIIILTGMGLVLFAVLAVTWNPTRVQPLLILNERV